MTDAILYVLVFRCRVGAGSRTSVVVAAVCSVAMPVRCCLLCLVVSSGRGLVGVGSIGLQFSAGSKNWSVVPTELVLV